MHNSVMEFCKRHITDARGKRVLEVGAYDVNGTVREFVEEQKPEIYIGTDLRACDHQSCYRNDRRCVDIVLPAEKLCELFAEKSFDIVICTEVLEHVQDWEKVLDEMTAVLKPGGYLIVTTRSPGFPFHEYPIDKWRFTVENMNEIFDDFTKTVEEDKEAPGVFVKATRKSSSCWITTRVFVDEVEKP